MTYVFEPPPRPAVPVVAEPNGATFPVRRVFCVGQNYADHAKEMGGDITKPDPFFFCKPADAIVATPDAKIPYPSNTENLHHEIELVVAIGKGGANIARDAALEHIYGYAVGVDLTRRDRQNEAKEQRRPWDVSKGFDNSAPISPITRVADYDHPTKAAIWLKVNGVMKQESDIANMIWPVADIIAFLSQSFALAPGDLIYTGTPSGVGPIVSGNKIEGGVAGLTNVTFSIA